MTIFFSFWNMYLFYRYIDYLLWRLKGLFQILFGEFIREYVELKNKKYVLLNTNNNKYHKRVFYTFVIYTILN